MAARKDDPMNTIDYAMDMGRQEGRQEGIQAGITAALLDLVAAGIVSPGVAGERLRVVAIKAGWPPDALASALRSFPGI